MAKLTGKKLKVITSPIKSLNQLNVFLDSIYLEQSAINSTHKSNIISFKFKGKGGTHKISYIGKFNYSSHYNFLQSKIYGYKHYINNKINETLTGVSFTLGEAEQASWSVKDANKWMSKIFKKKDTLTGSKANDSLWGYAGNDKIYGGSGNDLLNGGSGNDKLIGGSGNDTAVFSSKSNIVNLSTTKKQNTKDGLDTLIGIENVNAGSGNDKIYGSKGSNILNGGKGNDLLVGGSGNDKLIGGIGNDKLIGGSGKDIFKLSKGKGYDLIQDFKNSKDKILIGSIKKINLKNKGKDVLIYSGKDLLAKVKKAKGLLSKKGKYLV